MEDVKKNLPIGVILLFAVIVTGLAGWQYASNPSLGTQDTWGFYLWFTPLGYLLLTWWFKKTKLLNQWPIALGAILVYSVSAVLLFVPSMPPGLQWHYPIGAACLLFYFTSR